MSDPFIGEVRMFAGNFAPRGWAFCNGQLLPVSQNTALFSLLGTTYGGDGRTTFGVPNLQGRGAMHPGTGPGLTPRRLGESGGVETVTLNTTQIPSHTHTLRANQFPAELGAPGNSRSLARSVGGFAYQSDIGSNLSTMGDAAILPTGGGQAHNNLQPFLVVNFIIATQGTFPTRA